MKDSTSKIVAVIPVKYDSKRLPHKNLLVIGQTLMYVYTIEYAKSSKLLWDIVVSTDSDAVFSYCFTHNIKVLKRPPHLLGDVALSYVYGDFYHYYRGMHGEVDYVVGLQPDHPDRTSDLDAILRYVLDKDLDLLVTVGKDYSINGSVRVMKWTVFEGRVLCKFGTFLDDCTNVNTRDDFIVATERILRRRQ